jgi:hypothetical protein
MKWLKMMKLSHVKKMSCILFGLILLFASHATALYIIEDLNDPYNPDCPFDAAPGESVLFLNDYQGTGDLRCTIVDMDMTIGQYIQEQYPEVWNLLSPGDQENYNTLGAVYNIGASTPILPNNVKRLLASNPTGTNILKSAELSNYALSRYPISQLTSSTSRFTTIQQMQALPSYSDGHSDTVATGYFTRGVSSPKWIFNSAQVAGKGYV